MEKLFTDFSLSSKNELLQKIEKELKGKPFENLIFQSHEGITIQPAYTQEDINQIPTYSIPKQAAPWQTISEIIVKNNQEASKQAEAALQEGADSIFFKLDQNTQGDLTSLWQNIPIEQVYLQVPLSVFQKHADSFPKEVNILLDFVSENLLLKSWDASIWTDVATVFKSHPQISLDINAQNLNEAGANAVQELAFTLAIAVESLHQLSEGGIKLADILPRLRFAFGISSNYFMEISKIRAFRVLWAKVMESFGQLTQSTYSNTCFIHARTAAWNKPTADIYNNMIRLSTEAMSAILGGCDALTINPYNQDNTDTFANRISLNIANLLKEESYFDKVSAIPEGSYYLENLLYELVQNSWQLFQAVESKGGFQKAFQEGFIAEEIKKVAQKRLENLDAEKEIVIGLNKFQNPKEESQQSGIEFLTLGNQ